MSNGKSIEIDVTAAGTVSIEAKGFQGVGCAKATEQIELVLGGTGKKAKKPKPEMYQNPTSAVTGKLTF